MKILGMVRNFVGMLLLVKKMYENEKPKRFISNMNNFIAMSIYISNIYIHIAVHIIKIYISNMAKINDSIYILYNQHIHLNSIS